MEKAIVTVVLEVGMCLFMEIVRLFVNHQLRSYRCLIVGIVRLFASIVSMSMSMSIVR